MRGIEYELVPTYRRAESRAGASGPPAVLGLAAAIGVGQTG